MARLTITARLRLTPTDAGGRKTPVRSNYRPMFDVGASWMGKPSVNDGRIMLVDRDELAPGYEGLVRIEPMFSEFWGNLREGAMVPVQEGARVVGHTTIEKLLFTEGFTPSVATFVWKAGEFCSFIQEARTLPLDERMSGARRCLLALYSAALSLPWVEPTDHAKPPRSPEPPSGWHDARAIWEWRFRSSPTGARTGSMRFASSDSAMSRLSDRRRVRDNEEHRSSRGRRSRTRSSQTARRDRPVVEQGGGIR
jgi:hypothetical protein